MLSAVQKIKAVNDRKTHNKSINLAELMRKTINLIPGWFFKETFGLALFLEKHPFTNNTYKSIVNEVISTVG